MSDEDPCEQCGSTDFNVEDDGHTYCVNGHEQARGVITAEDDQDFARKGKIVRKKEKKTKQKFSKILRGVKAYQLYLQAWQYILWKQSYTLVHQLGLPAELWAVVRDLWSLWLTKLESRLHENDTSHETKSGEDENDTVNVNVNVNDADTDTDAVDTDAHTDADADVDNNRNRDRALSDRNNEKIQHAVRKGPGLIDTIVLNYLAMILLRCPIELATMLRWIQEEDIPYIRAIRFVPQEMVDRLPSEYQAALDTPVRLPRPDDLQLAVYRRSLMYDIFHGMVTPPLNHNLFFISYLQSLALPIEVYSLALRLNRVTKYNFAYSDQLEEEEDAADAAASAAAAQPTSRRRHATSFPEAQIISLIVTATKLLYPFDSDTVSRHPKSPNDLATLRMDWSAWLAAKKEMETSAQADPDDQAEGLKPGTQMAVTDEDVLNMTDTQVDQYLDWYQRTWLNPGATESQTQRSQTQPQESNTIDQSILNLFPLQPLPSAQKTRAQYTAAAQKRESLFSARVERVQAGLSTVRAITPAEEARQHTSVLRPGSRYARYRRVEDFGSGEGGAGAGAGAAIRVFHEQAAQVACLSVPALLRAVTRTETLIEMWRREKRREEYFAATEDDDHDDHDDLDDAEDEEGQEEDDGNGNGNGEGKGKAKAKAKGKGKGKATEASARHVGRVDLGSIPPPSSAALVRGLGGLDIADMGSPAAAGGGGDKDGAGGDRHEVTEDEDGDEDGEEEERSEMDVDSDVDMDMEMAMEYLPGLL